MIRKLYIENGITHHNVCYEFNKGSTLICGPNGAGKSLIQEFIRFALFGSAALRGKVSDYPSNLKVKLEFDAKGKHHFVERTLNDCNFDNTVYGTKACNKAISDCLGYDMKVFDMGNCAKQFEIISLGRMKPSERKQAVDQLIGINVIDKIIKRLNDEKKTSESYMEGLKVGLFKPIEPEKPENIIEDLNTLEDKIQNAIYNLKQWEHYKNTSERLKIKQPIWTGDIPEYTSKDVAAYEGFKEKIKTLSYEEPMFSEASDLEKEWQAHLQWDNWKEPSLTEEEVNEYYDEWSKYSAWKYGKKATCPQCGKVFTVGVEECKEPNISATELDRQKSLWLSKPKCDKPTRELTKEIYENERQKYKRNVEYETCKYRLDSYKGIDPQRVRDYETYKYEQNKWETYVYNLKKCIIYEQKKVKESVIEEWKKDLDANKIYQNQMKKYQEDLAKYKDLAEKIEGIESKISKYETQIKGLKEFKNRVKMSVIPSLSNVASRLVSDMTEGKFDDINIDEDFNILINGREIRTFSGSEEAIANLAIKLGLSSVLTRKVFNVFIGDEIDASMSEERAELVYKSLSELKSQIDQIILISHKGVDCDNEIHLC